eukprot:GILI01020858.1.p2 GENE.GILI01020858.1~~GILI01020858.1.p2  ORF type:complete len:178 (+),score=63.89 GILI01020858.1:71-604(+)
MAKTLLLISLSVLLFASASARRVYTHETSFEDGSVAARWTIDREQQRICMEVSSLTNGWLAFGFPQTVGSMVPADAIVGKMNENGDGEVGDYFLTERNIRGVQRDTQLGGTESLTETEMRREDGKTIMAFCRLLDTGDSRDTKLEVGQEVAVIWALGADDRLDYHADRGYGVISLTH